MSQKLRYYSTNRHLDQIPGINPFRETVSFREALLMGQAPDEGLFMPETIPLIPLGAFKALKGTPYTEAAMLVANAFLTEEFPAETLRRIVDDAYNYPVPLDNVFARKYVMRLDQGPTASFKDFAARMMARLMSASRDPGKRLNVLVATSGDTGSAVGDAFRSVEGIDVTILYPQGEVSGRQKKQLDTIGGNVQAVSMTGKFDDCQDLVKQAFSDPAFADFNLTSANSINFGRILPQIIYYVYAWAQLARDRNRPSSRSPRATSATPLAVSTPGGWASRWSGLSCRRTRTTSSPASSKPVSTKRSRRPRPVFRTP